MDSTEALADVAVQKCPRSRRNVHSRVTEADWRGCAVDLGSAQSKQQASEAAQRAEIQEAMWGEAWARLQLAAAVLHLPPDWSWTPCASSGMPCL